MGKEEQWIIKGQIAEKEESLKKILDEMKGFKQLLDTTWVIEKLHPEKLAVDKLETFATDWINSIKTYQQVKAEINQLKDGS